MESRFGMYFLANLQMLIYMNWPSEIVFLCCMLAYSNLEFDILQ